MLTDTRRSHYAKVVPLEQKNVKFTEGFWSEVVENTAKKTVPHLQAMFEDKDISHVLENFRICAGEAGGEHDGTVFGDGDFYKWMEAAIYAAEVTKDQRLLDQLEDYCELISRAQLEDGYLSTKQIIGERTGNGVSRMGDVNDFEIYNLGHLFTAACLYQRVTGRDSLMKVAVKAAGYLEKLYKEAREKGEVKTAVCPSHYMGLVEMYRTTGDRRYLELAKLAIELRDSIRNGSDDNQDRIPLKQQDKIIGHAVRANYLYAGVADLYSEAGNEEYLSMLRKVWRNLVDQKIYITGGCGALYNGASPYGNFFVHQLVHQAYGYEYQLPNVTAYNESCASVGLVLWAYRMFLIDPRAEYMDWLERAMLNVNLAAVSLDGKKYFYENTLRRAKKLPYELIWPLERTEYILSYCCPPNIARTLVQAGEYFYSVSGNAIWCGMYGANDASFCLENGAEFTLRQKTQYPYDGKITFTFAGVKHQGAVDLKIRIPAWAQSGYVKAGGKSYGLDEKDDTGYLMVTAVAAEGGEIEVFFDMPVRFTQAHSLVEETANQAAVEKGPLVYCIETPDAGLETLDDLMLDLKADFKPQPFEIAGREVVALEGNGFRIKRAGYDRGDLYQKLCYDGLETAKIRLIPYFAWDNRGYGEMRVWIPVAYR
ncbi:MAG TPA: hypothetical protein GXX75_19285 [Clostridiales bacterium]|nr:hypothetical protein [Clostridiales bacterium]